jgi:hypothetical protein
MGRLGELDISVLHDLDAIAPRIEKVEEGSRQQLSACGFDSDANTRAIIDDQPKMPATILMWVWRFHEVDELVAELNKGVARPFPPQGKIKNLAIKVEGLLDIANLEGDVVDADEPWLAPVCVAYLCHGCPSCWSVRRALTIYVNAGSPVISGVALARSGFIQREIALARASKGVVFSGAGDPLAQESC